MRLAQGACIALDCACISRKDIKGTWAVTFDTKSVSMPIMSALRAHSSNAIIDVRIAAGVGVTVTYVEKVSNEDESSRQ